MGKSFISTGVSVANSMVGSSMILFPLLFNQKGILVSALFVFLVSSLMSFTCKLLVDQLKPEEKDIGQSISRKMGPAYGKLFGLLSSFLLFLVSSVFFLLAVDVLFDCFDELFGPLAISEKIFKLIFVGVFGSLNYLKDLKYVFKLAPVAMGVLVISTIILIISIGFNIDNINSQFLTIKPLSAKDLLDVASVIGFAFICHPTIAPIVRQNQNEKDNEKSIYFGYGITTLLYILVGVLGALAIYGKHPAKDSNIIDYFSGQFQSPVIGILTFLYLFMISPIFPFVSKNQAIELIPKAKRQGISHLFFKSSIIYSILWIPMNILFIVTETAPSKVIGFISTVVAFYITYFLPIIMTVKKKDHSVPVEQKQEHRDSLIIPTADSEQAPNASLLTESQRNIAQSTGQIQLWKKIFFLGILLYGSTMLIFELVSFFIG